MIKLAVVGSSGVIGSKTLQIARFNREKIKVVALAVKNNFDALIKQINEFSPQFAAIENCDDFEERKKLVPKTTKLMCGLDAVKAVCELDEIDTVVFAASGFEPLPALLSALKSGKKVALANKECIVCAGEIIMQAANENGAKIIPVDSEHSAIYQCLTAAKKNEVQRLILTASGGAFRDYSKEQLKAVTAAQALNHPTWRMGKKITIDSATMANKGLEIIEASRLFSIAGDKIDYIIHRESIIHSMVEFKDNSLIAQMSCPDMQLPIQYALFQERTQSRVDAIDFARISKLSFENVREDVFSMPKLAKQALRAGGTMPTVFNAANEACVDLFLSNRLGFLDITSRTENALNAFENILNPSLEAIYHINKATKEYIYRGN